MSMFNKLSAGGIAIAGRTGSGKSSIFFGSQYVLDVLIVDTGSLGHRMYHRGGGECVLIDPTDKQRSPIAQVREHVARLEKEKRLWCLDSWSCLESAQVAWFKMVNNKPGMYQEDHKFIVGDLRDLGFVLATGHGFTLFNTTAGGLVRVEGKAPVRTPKGVLSGYPSLSGCTPGTETILSRWSTVWVAFPGWTPPDGSKGVTIPRGFVLPWDDFRGNDVSQYTPIKDPLNVLEAGRGIGPDGKMDIRLRSDPFKPVGECTIDAMLERIAAKYPDERKAPRARKLAPAAAEIMNGVSVDPAERSV